MIFFTSTCRKIIDSCDKYVLHTVVETLQYASPPVVASSLVQGGGGGGGVAWVQGYTHSLYNYYEDYGR